MKKSFSLLVLASFFFVSDVSASWSGSQMDAEGKPVAGRHYFYSQILTFLGVPDELRYVDMRAHISDMSQAMSDYYENTWNSIPGITRSHFNAHFYVSYLLADEPDPANFLSSATETDLLTGEPFLVPFEDVIRHHNPFRMSLTQDQIDTICAKLYPPKKGGGDGEADEDGEEKKE